MRNVLMWTLVLGVLCPTSSSAMEVLTNPNLDQTYPQVIVDNAPAGPGPEDFFLPKPLGWVNEGTRAITGPYEDELSSEPWAGPAPTPVTTDGSGAPSPDGCNGLDCRSSGCGFEPRRRRLPANDLRQVPCFSHPSGTVFWHGKRLSLVSWVTKFNK